MSSKKITKSQQRFERNRKKRAREENFKKERFILKEKNKKFSNKLLAATCSASLFFISAYSILNYVLTYRKEEPKSIVQKQISENKQFTLEDIVNMKGVKEVKHFDPNPDVILIPQKHSLNYEKNVNVVKIIKEITNITDELYDNNITSILYEGLDSNIKKIYDENHKIYFKMNSNTSEYLKEVSDSLNKRKWNLYVSELNSSIDVFENIEKIHMNYHKDLNHVKKENIEDIRKIKEYYSVKLDNYLTEDVQKQFFNEIYENRENRTIQECIKAKNNKEKIIVVYGYRHTEDFINKFKENHLKFTILIPNNFNGYEIFITSKYKKNCIREDYRLPHELILNGKLSHGVFLNRQINYKNKAKKPLKN